MLVILHYTCNDMQGTRSSSKIQACTFKPTFTYSVSFNYLQAKAE